MMGDENDPDGNNVRKRIATTSGAGSNYCPTIDEVINISRHVKENFINRMNTASLQCLVRDLCNVIRHQGTRLAN